MRHIIIYGFLSKIIRRFTSISVNRGYDTLICRLKEFFKFDFRVFLSKRNNITTSFKYNLLILYYEMQIYRGGSNRGAVVRNIEVVSILFSTYQSLILRFEFVKVKALKCEELSR